MKTIQQRVKLFREKFVVSVSDGRSLALGKAEESSACMREADEALLFFSQQLQEQAEELLEEAEEMAKRMLYAIYKHEEDMTKQQRMKLHVLGGDYTDKILLQFSDVLKQSLQKEGVEGKEA